MALKHTPLVPAQIYGSTQTDITSEITGRTYRVFIFKPDSPPPPSGYPVVVGTDGNMVFPIMATVDGTFALTGNAAIAVCVGYPTDDVMQLFTLRYRDLTPPTPFAGLPQRPGLPAPKLEDYGGSEEFLRFLTDELRPFIANMYPVDLNQQTLYGHSVAGMFTLYALLNRPDSFRNYVASSPALWWNKRALFHDLAKFKTAMRTKTLAPRILITVGGDEESVPATLPQNIIDAVKERAPWAPAALRTPIARLFVWKMMRDWRMIGNARSMARQLGRYSGRAGYKVAFHAFKGDDHLTALPASISRALAFALRP
jgi:predicted alpha/beta superfamily hydrolase